MVCLLACSAYGNSSALQTIELDRIERACLTVRSYTRMRRDLAIYCYPDNLRIYETLAKSDDNVGMAEEVPGGGGVRRVMQNPL
jgi:hypothetical protein